MLRQLCARLTDGVVSFERGVVGTRWTRSPGQSARVAAPLVLYTAIAALLYHLLELTSHPG